jgi:hypothetical protein
LMEVKSNLQQSTPVKAWRKPKPTALKQSELIGLRFTLSELEMIKEKAWLIPVATYLKDLLAKQTTIFCEKEEHDL